MIAFLNARKIKLYNATAVMLGANIGTTFTSVLTSINIDQYSYIILSCGLLLSFFHKTKQTAKLFLGIGFIFFSLYCLKHQLYNVFDNINYLAYFQKANNNIVLSTWNGILISGIIQSSSATIALAQICTTEKLISVLSGVCIVLGANIGTTFTGLIVSFKASVEAKVLSVTNLLINLIGVLIMLPFIKSILKINYTNTSLFLSFVHIIFNIVTCTIGLFFINIITRLSYKLIKKEPNFE